MAVLLIIVCAGWLLCLFFYLDAETLCDVTKNIEKRQEIRVKNQESRVKNQELRLTPRAVSSQIAAPIAVRLRHLLNIYSNSSQLTPKPSFPQSSQQNSFGRNGQNNVGLCGCRA
jgi:hypothetical protein